MESRLSSHDGINRRKLPKNSALTLIQTLVKAGYTAYFAGGWVRDLLLGSPSNEIDIATDAPPEKILALFPKTVAVGIHFGVVIVVMDGHHFEVSTFRKDAAYEDGRHPTAISFTTAEKDAERRDFTINGMFYNPLTQEVLDYVGGQEDLKKGIIRTIGNPFERFEEDKLRLVRAVRFAARFQFPIEAKTKEAIISLAPTLLPAVSIERIWQELTKMSAYPHFEQALLLLQDLGLLKAIFPSFQGDLAQMVAPFPFFPAHTPLIAYLLELFPTHSLEQHLALCDFFKTSKEERKLVEFFAKARQAHSKVEWTHIYAHPQHTLFLNIQEAKLLPSEKKAFHEEHRQRKKDLSLHIKRIEEKKPLVTATHLQERGILPGRQMGLLLKEAEDLAITHNLTTADAVLEHLKNSPLWGK